jgi:SAM-dependent methyltransferase
MIRNNEAQTQYTQEKKALDATGKTVFDDIYMAPDPRAYCVAMQSLDYAIPERAQPMFDQLFQHYRERTNKKTLRVLDIGSSYGINAALLSGGFTLPDFFERYTSDEAQAYSSQELLQRDKAAYQFSADNIEMIGFDISTPALTYAKEAGLIVDAVQADLEKNEITASQEKKLSAIDCIISSGCIGYVTTKTLAKIMNACLPCTPWMAHCVLRMFSLDDLKEFFHTRGYHVDIHAEPVAQRRFASDEEQQQVIARLKKLGVDPTGYEDTGWLYSWVVTAMPSVETVSQVYQYQELQSEPC